MQNSLLTTKLFFPPARPVLVHRPRLVERLQTGLQGPLTLLSAPAGSGKTTLLSEWRAGPGSRYPVGWVSLSADDNDLARFLQYLVTALDNLQGGIAKDIQPLVQTSEIPNSESILTFLINSLNGPKHESILVFDDYHLIELPAIHNALNFLLDNMPARLHLVLLTRSDPPFSLARLRARGQLTEIRAEHLRFSVGECTQFLNQVMGLDLSGEQVAALEKRTEGWIAGLQLAALSMQGREDVDGFVSAFTGSNHYIVDYLAEEVLNRQPEVVREFLLKTSILERLSGSLCDALTEREDGSEVLASLDHGNLFVVPMDNSQTWYRYHHLFGDLLQSRLLHLYAGTIPELHRRAARWFEVNGFFADAMDHLLLEGDYERACNLLGENTLAIIREHRLSEFIRWTKVIPDAIARTNPRVCLVCGYGQESIGNLEGFRSYIQSAQDALDRSVERFPPGSHDHSAILAEIKVNQANIAVRTGHPEQAIQLTDEAIAIAPENEHFALSEAYLYAAWARREMGQFKKIIPLCERALQEARKAQHPGMTMSAVIVLGDLELVLGHLTRARRILEDGLRSALEAGQGKVPIICGYYFGLARIHYQANELEQAEECIVQGLRLAEQGRRPLETLEGHMVQVKLWMANHPKEAVELLLEQAARDELPVGVTQFHEELSYYRAVFFAGSGKFQEALAWLEEVGQDDSGKVGYDHFVRSLRRCQLLLTSDRFDETLQLSIQTGKLLKECGCTAWQIEALVLQAIAWQKKSDQRKAMDCLKQALALAEPEGFARVFLNQGESMMELLHTLRKGGEGSEFVNRLVAAFDIQSPPKQVVSRKEILSKRELELLDLIAAGRSNKEIANELIISIGTVKRHTVNIFNKLDVKNRTEAVAKARELGLI